MNVFSADVALAITRLGLLILLGWFLAHRGWVGPHARQPGERQGRPALLQGFDLRPTLLSECEPHRH